MGRPIGENMVNEVRCEHRSGDGKAAPPGGRGSVSLPVVSAGRTRVRPSRMGRRRAAVLIAVHVLMIAHVLHWALAGRTLSPVEPSEAMYTLNHGYVNAGFLFFLAAIGATLVFGRFVCGWGCHFVAYQDFCAWLLKKIGIKPKPFRSRLLVLAPLALAIYMFVWPSVYRMFAGQPFPALRNHVLTTEFWATFPGPVVAILTFLIAGMAIVYFLGAKGFCTYACPYGGFFGLADQAAPGRILVTDACEHCGHCTAVCTSNVRVHEEVAKFGMVVDPGCMKCMDCVSVCPNDALYFGFRRSSLGAKPAEPRRPVPWDFTVAEEIAMVVVGLGALLAFRGLYDQIPLLLAMGMAAMFAFVTLKAFRLLRDANVRLQNLQLKRGGRLTRSGVVFAAMVAAVFVLTAHSGAVQYQSWRGRSLMVVHRGSERGSGPEGAALPAAIGALERADRWGLLSTYSTLEALAWAYIDGERRTDAEQLLERLQRRYPNRAGVARAKGSWLLSGGRFMEAIEEYQRAVTLGPEFGDARMELCGLLIGAGRLDEAMRRLDEVLTRTPMDAEWAMAFVERLLQGGLKLPAVEALEKILARSADHARAHHILGTLRFESGETSRGLGHLLRAAELDPKQARVHYDLGLALLYEQRPADAVEALREATRLKPDFDLAHYNLGVALWMLGRLDEALASAREALRLKPDDGDARAFVQMLEEKASGGARENESHLQDGGRRP
jgi:tetratricopeptide (TPR) repeat protein/ferredoxin